MQVLLQAGNLLKCRASAGGICNEQAHTLALVMGRSTRSDSVNLAHCGRSGPLIALAAGVGIAGAPSAGGSCSTVRLMRCGDDGQAEILAELPGSSGVAAILALPEGRLAGAGVCALRADGDSLLRL